MNKMDLQKIYNLLDNIDDKLGWIIFILIILVIK